MMRFLLFPVLVGAVLAQPLHAAEEQKELSFRVAVVVHADESIKSEVVSYINRELRSLGDIVLTDSDPLYEIQVVGLEAQAAREVVLSVVVAHRDRRIIRLLADTLDRLAPPRVRQGGGIRSKEEADALRLRTVSSFLVLFTHDLVRIGHHSVRTGPRSEMQQMCRKIVTDFDTEILEPSRGFIGRH